MKGLPAAKAGKSARARPWAGGCPWSSSSTRISCCYGGIEAFALRQAKRAVNQTLDIQGFYAAIQSVFDVHHTGHGNAISVGGYPILRSATETKEVLKST